MSCYHRSWRGLRRCTADWLVTPEEFSWDTLILSESVKVRLQIAEPEPDLISDLQLKLSVSNSFQNSEMSFVRLECGNYKKLQTKRFASSENIIDRWRNLESVC